MGEIIGSRRERYNCVENENHLFLEFEDGELGEIHVGDPLERAWTVIGFKDLVAALGQAGYTVSREGTGKGQ